MFEFVVDRLGILSSTVKLFLNFFEILLQDIFVIKFVPFVFYAYDRIVMPRLTCARMHDGSLKPITVLSLILHLPMRDIILQINLIRKLKLGADLNILTHLKIIQNPIKIDKKIIGKFV